MTDQMTATQTEQDKESRGGYIYKIVFPNGKHYIGMTIRSIEQRTKEHRYKAKRGTQCLYKALRKYDMVDTFELIEIDTADSIEELCELEIHYIEEYKSFYMDEYNSYNMTRGGEGCGGYVWTEDDKQRMSERMVRYFEDPKARQKQSAIRKLYFKDHPEAGKEQGERQKKYFEDHPEARQEYSERQKRYHEENPEAGKEHSERMKKYFEGHPEAGKEHSERMKKYYDDHPEAGKEHSERMKLYYDDPKTRQEHSEKLKRYFEDNPEARQECSERKKRYYEDNPEARKETSERMKRYYEDPKARQECSERKKRYFEEHPEARKIQSENAKKLFDTPDKMKNMLDARGHNKPFDVFKRDGLDWIGTFTYQFEAKAYLEKEYGIVPLISPVLLGRMKSSRGFTFKYSDPLDRKNVNFDERYIENKKKRLDMKGKNKPFMVFKCDDESLVSEFTYEFEAKEYLKKEYGNVPKIEGVAISTVLRGKIKSSKGFIFKYK